MDHTFQAVVNGFFAAYFAVSVFPTFNWASGKLGINTPADKEPQDEPSNPKEHLAQKIPIADSVVIADTSGRVVKPGELGSWLPPMDRLNEARLNGEWVSSGPHEYRWSQNAHQLEIHVPGGGKWKTKYDGGWVYLTPEK